MRYLPLKLLSVLLTSLFFSLCSSHTSLAANFMPGRIIDDVVFTNNLSMNPSQIQNFLNSKVPVCDTWGTKPSEYGGGTRRQYAEARGDYPPYTCLKDYSENGRAAAQIIYDIAQAYRINPQVLIVLLQKEQHLITDGWPMDVQYRTATGYGCPDSTPGVCDSAYYGFTNQVTWSAKMFRAILNASPTWYTPYVLGNNYIQYDPDTSCGGSTVYIQNRSTQALYNYTPYQPNAAALAAGYGSAEPCGAYGNRNFFLYFTDWFGVMTIGLIKAPNGGIFFLDENGFKRAFPDEITFISHGFKFIDAVSISESSFNAIPHGPLIPYNTHYRDGKLVNVAGGMFIIENGLKRPFPDESTFTSFGYTWASALVISSSEASLIPYGAPLAFNAHFRNGRLITAPGVGVFLVEDGLKRPFPSETVFASYGYKWTDVVYISSAEMSRIPDGNTMAMR